MKSIQRLFEKVAREHPNWGSVIVFNHIVDGKNFSRDRIARWFNVLVDKEEYDRSEKKEILEYVYLLNSPLNRTKNDNIAPLREAKKEKMNTDKSGIKNAVKTEEIICKKN
ncbi:MAG: hypothetical protein WC839_01875 [Candidatus Paceibacterota bacterium]